MKSAPKIETKQLQERPSAAIQRWDLKFLKCADFHAARIVIDGPWASNTQTAQQLLKLICKKWTPRKKIKYLITCGGFVQLKWPTDVTGPLDDQRSKQEALTVVQEAARKWCKDLYSKLGRELSKCAEFLSLGIDFYRDPRKRCADYHAELICVLDLSSGSIHLTGKSYPTIGQEKTLLRQCDLKTHLMRLNEERVMVLGCHDLTVFNPRSDAKAKRWRKGVKKGAKKLARNYRPKWVLHHPHITTKTRTWLVSRNALLRSLPSVQGFVSAGVYSHHGKRDPLDRVRAATASGAVMDIVVHMHQAS